MDNPQGILRTGDRATVEFEFMTQPEFIKVGSRILFREGKTKVCLYLLEDQRKPDLNIGSWRRNEAPSLR